MTEKKAPVAGMWRSFHAIAWIEIKGRGRLAQVDCPFDWNKEDPSQNMIGDEVLIDGKLYRVKGIESWAVTHISRGAPIGLLVEEVACPPSRVDCHLP